MLLVTGALHAEGKTTATGRLGSALAQAGHRVLLVSADLRVPRLHEMFGLPLDIGLSDILTVLDWDTGVFDEELMARSIHELIAPLHDKGRRGELHVITSGAKAKDPGRLIAGPAMTSVPRGFVRPTTTTSWWTPRRCSASPTARRSRATSTTCCSSTVPTGSRSSTSTSSARSSTGCHLRPIGIVVIGTRGEISPYYMQRRPALFEEDEAQRC